VFYRNGVKKRSTILGLLLIFVLVIVGTTACTKEETVVKEKPTLVFADAGWDSIRFHNDVAKVIIENGYGYKTDVLTGSTPVTFEGLRRGDIDIYTEVWTDNLEVYPEAIKSGDILEVSVNFDDNMQGMYVPTYVIKGDSARGIKALAPELKTVEDLPKYWKIFTDPEDKKKGRIYGAIPGWAVDEIMTVKIENYGLDKTYNIFRPGSEAALTASMAQAVERGLPWIGYYWEPTWIMGKYDMTLIEEAAYDQNLWKNDYTCAFPPVKVTVCINKEMIQEAPDVVEFLKHYQTSSKITSEALAYMQDNNVSTEVAAKWFLKNNKEIWAKWVSADVAKKVEAAL